MCQRSPTGSCSARSDVATFLPHGMADHSFDVRAPGKDLVAGFCRAVQRTDACLAQWWSLQRFTEACDEVFVDSWVTLYHVLKNGALSSSSYSDMHANA